MGWLGFGSFYICEFISSQTTDTRPLSGTPALPTFCAIKTAVVDYGLKAPSIEFNPCPHRKNAEDCVENIA